MRLYKTFALLTCFYIVAELFLTICPLFGLFMPNAMNFMAETGTYLLFLTTYLSLVYILRHFQEKKWFGILLSLSLLLSVGVLLSRFFQVDKSIIIAVNIANTFITIAFSISNFYVKAKEIASLFKWLAVCMLVTSLIRVLMPWFLSDYFRNDYLPWMMAISTILSLIPIVVIFLLNRKMDLMLSRNMALLATLAKGLSDNKPIK